MIYNLEQTPAWYIDDLKMYFRLLSSNHEERVGREIELACEAASALKQMFDTAEGSPFPAQACRSIVAFTEIQPESEYEHCYDLLLLAVAHNLLDFVDYLSPESDYEFWQAAAALLHKVAAAAQKPTQMSVGAMSVAIVSLALSDQDERLQFDTFRACEVAVERLRALKGGERETLGAPFINALLQRRFTWALLAYFAHDSAAIPRREELLAIIGAEPWPLRVRQLTEADYLSGLRRLVDLFRLEFEIDNHRYNLELAATTPSITVEWTNWRFEHNAYRRAVPHSKSLLREKDFSSIVLDLVHEVTHVLSLIGGLGMAACMHRVAAFYAAFRVWEWTGTIIPVDGLLATHGLPHLRPGYAKELPAVMAVLAPLENARTLQDIWTPWFEGVAVFAESASDPAGDDTTINDVLLLVRNLTDFYPKGESSAQIQAEFNAFQAEIERRISKVIQENSSDRLRMFFAAQDSTYMAGYLIVRAIVAQWRITSGKPLSGAKCLQILLHATRYLTTSILPDLSLPAARLKDAALASWLRFIDILIKLPSEDIDAFNMHGDASTSGRPAHWIDGRLKQMEESPEAEKTYADEMTRIFDRMRGEVADLAERSLASYTQGDSWTAIGQAAETYLEFASGRKNTRSPQGARLINSIMNRMSILPIGAADARFCLNIVTDSDSARIDVALRTTEKHVDSGEPSMDFASWTLPRTAAELIAKNYSLTGEPTLRVSRVVDVGAFGESGNDFRFAQMYWLQYGDWTSIEALNPYAKALLDSIPNRQAITEQISARLRPNSVHQFEQELANGLSLSKKVLAWLDDSDEWKVLDFPLENDVLLERVRAAALFLTERSARVDLQSTASRTGLAAIFGDASWIEQVVSAGYDALTADFAYQRQKVADVMAATGRTPLNSAFLDQSNAEISSYLPIFIKTRFGWDIGPARLSEEHANDH